MRVFKFSSYHQIFPIFGNFICQVDSEVQNFLMSWNFYWWVVSTILFFFALCNFSCLVANKVFSFYLSFVFWLLVFSEMRNMNSEFLCHLWKSSTLDSIRWGKSSLFTYNLTKFLKSLQNCRKFWAHVFFFGNCVETARHFKVSLNFSFAEITWKFKN